MLSIVRVWCTDHKRGLCKHNYMYVRVGTESTAFLWAQGWLFKPVPTAYQSPSLSSHSGDCLLYTSCHYDGLGHWFWFCLSPIHAHILRETDKDACRWWVSLSLSLSFSLPLYLGLSASLSTIQGDGISYETIGDILEHMKVNKWSADNVAFGSGGALLQRLHRDTQKCAYKCSYAIINGKGVSELVWMLWNPSVRRTPCVEQGCRQGFISYLLSFEEGCKCTFVCALCWLGWGFVLPPMQGRHGIIYNVM